MRRFQFSIRLMLTGTAAVAVAVGAFAALPSRESYTAMAYLALLFPTLSIIAATRTQGVPRVFWAAVSAPLVAGALISTSAHLLGRGMGGAIIVHPQLWDMPLNLSMYWCFAPLNGVVCVFIHWLFWPDMPDRD